MRTTTFLALLAISLPALSLPAPAQSCGDCDLDGASPTILDALSAARFSLSWVPAPEQLCTCDVDASGVINIIDALRIAQTAAGLPGTLMCVGDCSAPIVGRCRVVDQLATTAAGPVGLNPAYATLNGGPGVPPASGAIADTNQFATNFWDFDYVGLNQGEFNRTVQLTDQSGANVGNPVVLFSAGQDYTGVDVDPVGPCNARDTFQLVLEATLFSPGGEVMLDLAAASTPFLSAQLLTTWTSSDPAKVSVSPDGLLQAEGENACATIGWTLASTNPAVVIVLLARQSGAIVACVDSGGVDSVTRATWLPVGDVDANVPGSPSGAPFPGIGQEFGVTLIANSGASGVGAYAATMLNDENVFVTTWSDVNGVGGSTQPGLGLPFAVGGGPRPWRRRWNDVDAFASTSGIFDLATVNYEVVGPGTGFVQYHNEELADGIACNIWVRNPCMPFSGYVCPVPPPAGGYVTIAGSGTATVP